MMLNLTQHILTKEQAQNRIKEPLNKRYVCSLLTFYDIPTESDLKLIMHYMKMLIQY